MKNVLKIVWAFLFLTVFFPYTAILFLNGSQGTGREERLPDREYQVLDRLLQEDFNWMDQETLCLMAILIRTELVRTGTYDQVDRTNRQTEYEAAYEAVKETCGNVVTVEERYQELPYHKISAGKTRTGRLLDEDHAYIKAVECPEDQESEQYLHIIRISRKEFMSRLSGEEENGEWESPELERDSSGYVTHLYFRGKAYEGEAVRERLHLPSSCFSIDDSTKVLRIAVKGEGHGFGISLYTADQMIRNGMSYEDVIHKFYEHAECITIP